MLVKICGITRVEDALAAQQAGADCFGVNTFPKSPRSVTIDKSARDYPFADVTLPVVFVTVDCEPHDLLVNTSVHNPLALQLHGDESPQVIEELRRSPTCPELWKVIHVPADELDKAKRKVLVETIQSYRRAGCTRVMIDTHIPVATDEKRYGGTGLTSDWRALREVVETVSIPVILMGGLTPDNVAEAIDVVRPAGVDCSSGVEFSPGLKDPEKIRAFVASARRADTSHKSR